MLGSIYDDVPYETYPDIKSKSDLSEDEQVKIIERALYGDLKGVIDVTEADMDLYNRHRHGTESYANEYRKATEFSYVPRNKQKEIKEARARELGITPPSTTFYGNPVLSGYQSFTGSYQQPPQQYQYPDISYNNPYPSYSSYGYQGYGYYGGYGYQQPVYDCGDPNMNLIMMMLNQTQNQYNNGYYYNNYGYYQPRPDTIRFNVNQQPMPTEQSLSFVIDDKVFAEGLKFDIPEVAEPVYPKGYNPLATIEIPKEVNDFLNRPSYSNMYAMQQQIQKCIKAEQERQQAVWDDLNRRLLGAEEYDNIKSERQEYINQVNKEDYKRRHAYDSLFYNGNLSEQERKVIAQEKQNTDRLMRHFRNNPYGISYDPSKAWQEIIIRYYNDKETQAMLKDIPADMSAIEVMNIGYPKYLDRKKFEEFYMNARKDAMGYDSSRYRQILTQSGLNASPYLGRSSPTLPGQISSPDSITQRYNERRNSYIRDAEKRGDVR